MEQEIKTCIYGATGYTGAELLRILQKHPHVKITALTSQSYAGKRLSEVFPFFEATPLGSMYLTEEPEEDFEFAFLCLPHEASLHLVPGLLQKGKRVIDLSGAYRISKPEMYPEYYGFEHVYPVLLKRVVYGLPELFRERIKNSDFVANPGCYPTATLLAIYPLLREGIEIEDIIVDALSGVSGAGRKTAQHFHFPEMEGNAFAYSVARHRHTPEMEDVIQRLSGKSVKVRFTPQVIPLSRGMMVKVYVRAEERDYMDIYRKAYGGEPFVIVLDKPPHIKQALGTNHCYLYLHYDKRLKLLTVISVIDNLGKGASSQAVQNMNLMLGFEESTALKDTALYP